MCRNIIDVDSKWDKLTKRMVILISACLVVIFAERSVFMRIERERERKSEMTKP